MSILTLNGTPIQGTLGDLVKREVVETAKRVFRDRLVAIRHPDTGEFPTVTVHGAEVRDLRWTVEGSPELLALMRIRLSPEDLAMVTMTSPGTSTPHVFLSYASKDEALGGKLARALHAKGIDVWWAPWSINAGDNLPSEISTALDKATDFIFLVTEDSLKSTWVEQEWNAGLVKKLSGKMRLIPVRSGINPDQLPLLLQPVFSPSIDDFDKCLAEVISAVFQLSKKPALGPPPVTVASRYVRTGYSAAANAVAEYMVKSSLNATHMDPSPSTSDLATATGLSDDDLTDALYELRDYVEVSFDRVSPKDSLFAAFDEFWQPWNPAEDGLLLAARMVNDDSFPVSCAEISERLSWPARRLNPALAYLKASELIEDHATLGCGPFIMHRALPNESTRRYVKSRA